MIDKIATERVRKVNRRNMLVRQNRTEQEGQQIEGARSVSALSMGHSKVQMKLRSLSRQKSKQSPIRQNADLRDDLDLNKRHMTNKKLRVSSLG